MVLKFSYARRHATCIAKKYTIQKEKHSEFLIEQVEKLQKDGKRFMKMRSL